MNIKDRITLDVDEVGVARVTLTRANKHNALDFAMFMAIRQCQKWLNKNRSVRVVVLQGEGEDFCTGLDTKSVMNSPSQAIRLLFKYWPSKANLAQQACIGWRQLSVPVIAVIHGRCWGGGLQVALGADIRLVTENASLSIMESHWGLIPDMGGNKLLSELMPIDQAKYLAMTAQSIDAKQAILHGLATAELSQDRHELNTLISTLLKRSPDVLAGVKGLYNHNWHKSLGNMLGAETVKQIRILMSPNQKIAQRRAQGQEAAFHSRKIK